MTETKVFLFKRSDEVEQSPQRGPGGGKVRSRQRRRERVRREPRLLDTAILMGIAAIVLLLVYHYLLNEPWVIAIGIAVVFSIVGVGFNYWLARRRHARLQEQSPKPSQRRPRRR